MFKRIVGIILVLVSLSVAGSVWIEYYGDCTYNGSSCSMLDTYYSNTKVGLSLEQFSMFLSYYQYGMYGKSDIFSYFGVGIKRGILLGDRFYFEPFLIIQRDFGIDDSNIWFGVYFRVLIKEW
jgi:hypothetical protein